MNFKKLKMGPGAIIAAAFIGPGTITVCTIAGAKFGYDLVWALVVSILLCMILQEVAARIGVITQKGLGENFIALLKNKLLRGVLISIIISAIVIGNAAYEAGNISGGVLGLELLFGSMIQNKFFTSSQPFIIGIAAFALLYMGSYKVLERILISLVITMSIAFLLTAIVSSPDLVELFKGLKPKIPSEGIWTVLGLLGTTVVPYNLFLHASIASTRWKPSNLITARNDVLISILVGGIISLSILVTAIASQNENVDSALDLIVGIEPVFGAFSRYIIGLGLFAAGITSAITAPLAAAYVAKECFHWNSENILKDFRFRGVWIIILLVGVLFSVLKIKPIFIIQFAQVANAIILPVVAVLLIIVSNKKRLMGNSTNTLKNNILILLALIITFVLCGKGIFSVVEKL